MEIISNCNPVLKNHLVGMLSLCSAMNITYGNLSFCPFSFNLNYVFVKRRLTEDITR